MPSNSVSTMQMVPGLSAYHVKAVCLVDVNETKKWRNSGEFKDEERRLGEERITIS